MSSRSGNSRWSKNKRPIICPGREIKRIGSILAVFGIMTICAFFLPVKAWILLLGVVLIYCGFKLTSIFK